MEKTQTVNAEQEVQELLEELKSLKMEALRTQLPLIDEVIQLLENTPGERQDIDIKKAELSEMENVIIKINESLEHVEYLKKTLIQNELFPLFKPQKTVEFQKEFALNFGGLEKIRKNYRHL